MTTWTLREIIQEVDPDYFRAPLGAEYAFANRRRFELRAGRGAYDGTVYPDEAEGYLLADGSRPMDEGYEPAAARDIATKGYVDALVAAQET